MRHPTDYKRAHQGKNKTRHCFTTSYIKVNQINILNVCILRGTHAHIYKLNSSFNINFKTGVKKLIRDVTNAI